HPVPSTVDRLLKPLHRWIWADAGRRARKLLRFAETEADGGRDLARAAELTRDPVLRRLFFRHAGDEQRHADLFGRRGRELSRAARIWSAYLRLASAGAGVLGRLLLLVQYFLLLPPFALLAKRASRSEPVGFAPARRPMPMKSQY